MTREEVLADLDRMTMPDEEFERLTKGLRLLTQEELDSMALELWAARRSPSPKSTSSSPTP